MDAELEQDLRNHGESPHNKIHDYPSMAEDVEEFIRCHDIKLPGLIGHSMYVVDYCMKDHVN